MTEVAARYGVSRQSVHAWLRRRQMRRHTAPEAVGFQDAQLDLVPCDTSWVHVGSVVAGS